MIEKVQESHLYMWLKEKDSKFLSKLDETIEYANTILPQINNVFASYTVHGVRHSINVMEYMYALVVDINKLSEPDLISINGIGKVKAKKILKIIAHGT